MLRYCYLIRVVVLCVRSVEAWIFALRFWFRPLNSTTIFFFGINLASALRLHIVGFNLAV